MAIALCAGEKALGHWSTELRSSGFGKTKAMTSAPKINFAVQMSGGSLFASAAFAALVMNGLFGNLCSQVRPLAFSCLSQGHLGSSTGWEGRAE